jgi:hypothetical protein
VLAASGSVVRSYPELVRAVDEIKIEEVFILRNWSEEDISYE